MLNYSTHFLTGWTWNPFLLVRSQFLADFFSTSNGGFTSSVFCRQESMGTTSRSSRTKEDGQAQFFVNYKDYSVRHMPEKKCLWFQQWTAFSDLLMMRNGWMAEWLHHWISMIWIEHFNSVNIQWWKWYDKMIDTIMTWWISMSIFISIILSWHVNWNAREQGREEARAYLRNANGYGAGAVPEGTVVGVVGVAPPPAAQMNHNGWYQAGWRSCVLGRSGEIFQMFCCFFWSIFMNKLVSEQNFQIYVLTSNFDVLLDFHWQIGS